GGECAVAAGHDQRGVVGDEVANGTAVGGNRRDRQRLRRHKGVDRDHLARGGTDIGRRVHDPRLIGEAGGVRVGGVVKAPGGCGGLCHIGPGAAAFPYTTLFRSGGECAVAAGHDQRGVVGDEVANGTAVGGNRRDRQRLRRHRDGERDRLARGGTENAGSIDDPRLMGEAGAVRVGGVVKAPGGCGGLCHLGPGGAAVFPYTTLFRSGECAVAAGHDQRGVVGDEVANGTAVGGNRRDRQRLR